MWKLIHRVRYSEVDEARIRLTSPLCELCGDVDIDRIYMYFKCEKLVTIGESFLRVLKVFDPHYSLEEIMDFKGKEEHPQLYWFIALTLFYIDENRKRGNRELYRAFMWSEFETLKISKWADDDFLMAINIILELLES